MKRWTTALSLGAALAASATLAQTDGLAPLDGLFSADQAARGGQVFAGQCASCHTPSVAAALFLERSAGQTLADYHQKLSGLMPPQSEQRPSPAQFLDIIAYLSREAGAQSGAAAAGLTDPAWRQVRLAAGAKPRQASARLTAPNLEWKFWRGSPQG